MSKFQELVDAITAYDKKQIADEWSVGYYEEYENISFDKLVESYNGDAYIFAEISHRVSNYFDFLEVIDDEDWDGMLRIVTLKYEAFKTLDEQFNEDWVKRVFGKMTPKDVVANWKREAEWEKEEEARQEAREFCANFIFNDGMVDTIDEAYDLFDMACGY